MCGVFSYSDFLPTLPPLRSPKKLIMQTTIIDANISQKAAWYPFSRSLLAEWSVTDAATAALTAKPTEFPTWETELNTAPARDWFLPG